MHAKMVAGETSLTVLLLPPLFHPSPLTAKLLPPFPPISSSPSETRFINDDQVSGAFFHSGDRSSTASKGPLLP